MKGYHEVDVAYNCTNCNTNFTSKTVKQHSSKFCSDKCRLAFGFKDETCAECKENFKVRKNKQRSNYFCSKQCYHSWQSKNVKPPQTENRKAKANSLEAIEKRKKTWEVTGRLFNFRDNKDWKRFYKKCDSLTRAMRAKMLEEWDGYDYYDGEYIKPYLELSVHHKNYPTLDHKYPRSRAFQDGLTPYEITVKQNLVWTKRTNNSKKGNK
jgi:endogenous inhibitor of DNA gyrase (YacG/DUF329 family)